MIYLWRLGFESNGQPIVTKRKRISRPRHYYAPPPPFPLGSCDSRREHLSLGEWIYSYLYPSYRVQMKCLFHPDLYCCGWSRARCPAQGVTRKNKLTKIPVNIKAIISCVPQSPRLDFQDYTVSLSRSNNIQSTTTTGIDLPWPIVIAFMCLLVWIKHWALGWKNKFRCKRVWVATINRGGNVYEKKKIKPVIGTQQQACPSKQFVVQQINKCIFGLKKNVLFFPIWTG